ncbi:MAG TPA: CinA family protein [Thermoplasmata archaeon]
MTTAREVGNLLRERGLTISVAESCTGGKLGDLLTNVSGSSDYFVGGVISYSNKVKVDLLGVRKATLATDGAVSESVARQMSNGIRRRVDSDIGVGITGVAGPSGGTPRKPVGLVYIAVSSRNKTRCTRNLFKGTRTAIKRQSVSRALEMIGDILVG